MSFNSRSLLLAASLMAMPVAGAMAQNQPVGSGAGGAAATQTPADHSGTSTTMGTSSTYGSAAANPSQPGATGQTIVPGSNSSMAGSNRVVPNPGAGATSAGAAGGSH